MKKYSLLLLSLLLTLVFTGCEDSFLMRKLKKQEVAAPTSAPKKSPALPTATEKSPTPPSEKPEDNIINKLLENKKPTEPTDILTEKVPAVPKPAEDDNSSLKEEIRGYVQCLNRTRDRVNQSKARYLSWISSEVAGPNCKERYITYGLYTLYDDGMKTCRNAADNGAQTPPSLPELEAAAKQLATSYETLVPLVQEVYDYYEQEDYKDDQCVKAKAYHPKLMAAFNEFQAASAIIDQALDPLQDKIVADDLARLETQGKKIPWHVVKFVQSAQGVQKQIPATAEGAWNIQGYNQAYTQLEKDYEALEAYVQANPEEAQKIMLFSMFSSNAKDFYVQAKFLRRDLADSKKVAPNSVNKLIREYNQMVNQANSLRY